MNDHEHDHDHDHEHDHGTFAEGQEQEGETVEKDHIGDFAEGQEVEHVTFSGAYSRQTGQRVLYVTERAVFSSSDDGLVIEEIAPGIDLEKDIIKMMDFEPIVSPSLKVMDPLFFRQVAMARVSL